ncbi:hypothetical protein ACFRCG_21240 [Embleya sp. NPDC056575]|uniref:hypothetical protein n=1 Tax=unclassified Embleya TaxID=2699296 RepID=UPI0036A4F14E
MNPGEPARPGEDRIHHRVDDVDDAGQLMRYALAAQLARLERHGIPQNAVARGAGSAPAKVTGSLQTPTRKTESPDGRSNGCANLAIAPTDARIREMHAVLFAIGDCFGAGFGARDRGNLKTVRAGTAPILREPATGELTRSDPRFHVVARALVYLLTFTAQDRRAGRVDLSEELLEALRDHPDETTREFCEWTLAFRFGADGKVRSLLYAADPDD